MFKRYWRNNKGSVVVITVVAIPVLLGFAALAIDMSSLYLEKTRLTNAADAAALGGGQRLPKDTAQAVADAKTVAKKNGVSDSEIVKVEVGTNPITGVADAAITVDLSRKVPLILSPVLGNLSEVTAHAKAAVAPSKTVPWIVPFVLPKATKFDYTHEFTMRVEADWTNSNLYEIDYMNVKIEGSQTSQQYLKYLEGGYKQPFDVGKSMYYLDPSSGGPSAVDAFAKRVSNDSNTDYKKARVGDARLMLVPLVDELLPRTTKEGTPMKIIGFVGFWLKRVDKNDYYKTYRAYGRFIEKINVGVGDWSDDPTNDYFGCYAVRLIE